MVFDPSGHQLLRLLYDNRLAGPDRELDEEVTRVGLVPVAQMPRLT
jgi:hypothetical protein